jgi:hypothetical protein
MAYTISLEDVMQQFDPMVQAELQNAEKLDGTIREYDTKGTNFNLPFFDQLALKASNFSSGDIPVVDVAQRNVVVTQAQHNLKTTIGDGYDTLFNFDVVQGHVRQHAKAIGRYKDQLKLSALIAGDASFTAGNNNLITGAGLKVSDLVQGTFMLLDNGVDEGNLAMYTSAKNLDSFYNDEDFKSWDQNAERPLMKGRVPRFYMGVDMRVLGSASLANTLPGGVTPSNYILDYESIAVAYNRRPTCAVHAEPENDRVSVLSVATAGAAIALPKAIIKITTTL